MTGLQEGSRVIEQPRRCGHPEGCTKRTEEGEHGFPRAVAAAEGNQPGATGRSGPWCVLLCDEADRSQLETENMIQPAARASFRRSPV